MRQHQVCKKSEEVIISSFPEQTQRDVHCEVSNTAGKRNARGKTTTLLLFTKGRGGANSGKCLFSLTPGQVIGNVDNPPIFVAHNAVVKHGKTKRSRLDGGLDAVMSPSPHLQV